MASSNVGSRHVSVRVVCGALDRTQADVLVTTTTKKLSMSSGHLSAAILKSAGPELQRECNASYPMGLHRGEVAVTRGYKLQCQRVYHGCLGKFKESRKDECFVNLRRIITECLIRANAAGFKSIAIPALGTGKLRYPCSTVAAEMFSCIDRFRAENQSKTRILDNILLVVFPGDGDSLQEFKKIEEDLNSRTNIQQPVYIAAGDDSKAIPTIGHVGKVTCQEYTALVMVHRELFNRLHDNGVAFSYNNDTVCLTGNSEQVEKVKKDVKAAVEEMKTMHQLTLPVAKLDSSVIESEIHSINAKFPKIVFVRNPLRGVVATFGYDLSEVQAAHDAFSEVINANKTLKTPPSSSKENSYEDDRKSCGDTSKTLDACSTSTHGNNVHTYHAGDVVVRMYAAQIADVTVDCVIHTVKANSTATDNVGALEHATAQKYDGLQKKISAIQKEVSSTKTDVSLPEKEVLRVALPCWWNYKPITMNSLKRLKDAMYTAIINVLLEADRVGHKTVCLAVASYDDFRVPQEICSMIYAKSIRSFSLKRNSIDAVHVVGEDMNTIHIMQDMFQSILIEGNDSNFDITRYIDKDQTTTSEQEFSNTDSDDSCNSDEPVKSVETCDNDVRTGQDKTTAPVSHIINDDQTGDCDNNAVIHTQRPDLMDSDDNESALPPPLYREDGDKLLCFFPPGKKISIYTGDISELKNIDAIVCSEDKSGGALGKIAKRLVQLGGKVYKIEKEAAFQKQLEIGDVVVTNGGQNIYKWVMHALLPHNRPDDIEIMITDILEEASKRKMNSIAMALLGTGWKQVSGLQAQVLYNSYSRFCRQNLRDNLTVHVVNIDPAKTEVIKDVFRRNIELLRTRICCS